MKKATIITSEKLGKACMLALVLLFFLAMSIGNVLAQDGSHKEEGKDVGNLLEKSDRNTQRNFTLDFFLGSSLIGSKIPSAQITSSPYLAKSYAPSSDGLVINTSFGIKFFKQYQNSTYWIGLDLFAERMFWSSDIDFGRMGNYWFSGSKQLESIIVENIGVSIPFEVSIPVENIEVVKALHLGCAINLINSQNSYGMFVDNSTVFTPGLTRDYLNSIGTKYLKENFSRNGLPIKIGVDMSGRSKIRVVLEMKYLVQLQKEALRLPEFGINIKF